MKILAVDDEYMQLRLLERSIKGAVPECELTCFDNSVEALAWAKEQKPEIIFCDIQMPVMTGIELAKEIKKVQPKTNIVFVTGYYEDYAVDAMSLHFSGYLHKPANVQSVMTEIENLRYPLPVFIEEEKLKVRCFGTFDVFWKDKPLLFERRKTKELLAYLIDRHGSSVTSGEICAALYEDDINISAHKSDLRKAASDLRRALKEIGMESVFIKGFNAYAVDTSKLTCDYYDWEDEQPYAIRAFHGEYMSQYSWGEETLGAILQS